MLCHHHHRYSPAKDALQLRNNAGGVRSNSSVSVASVPAVGVVSVSVSMESKKVETGDSCKFEVSGDGGATWTTLLSLAGGGADVNGVTQTVTASALAFEAHGLDLRMALSANTKWEMCYLKEVSVSCA